MEVSGQLHPPGRFTPRERFPGTHWIGGWVGPRAILDAVLKRKIPSPCHRSNHRTLIIFSTREPVCCNSRLDSKRVNIKLLYPQVFQYNFLATFWYAFLVSPMCATSTTHLTLLDLLGWKYSPQHSTLNLFFPSKLGVSFAPIHYMNSSYYTWSDQRSWSTGHIWTSERFLMWHIKQVGVVVMLWTYIWDVPVSDQVAIFCDWGF